MEIIEVKVCWKCPYNDIINRIEFCSHPKYDKQMGRDFKENDDTENGFPKWCPLKDKPHTTC